MHYIGTAARHGRSPSEACFLVHFDLLLVNSYSLFLRNSVMTYDISCFASPLPCPPFWVCRPGSNSEFSCFPNAGVIVVYHHAQLSHHFNIHLPVVISLKC
jgi:hypothetical protein